MHGKRFCSLTRQKKAKFDQCQKIEFKKSFEIYRQLSLKVLMKVGLKDKSE
jgi:hypothetical protein